MKKLMLILGQVILLFCVGFFGTGFVSLQSSKKQSQPPVSDVSNPSKDAEEVTNKTTSKAITTTASAMVESEKNESSTTKKQGPAIVGTTIQTLSNKNVASFYQEKAPSILIVVNETLWAASGELISEVVSKGTNAHAYLIHVETTDLSIEADKMKAENGFQISIYPAIYYLNKNRVYYHLSLKEVSEDTLRAFLTKLGA